MWDVKWTPHLWMVTVDFLQLAHACSIFVSNQNHNETLNNNSLGTIWLEKSPYNKTIYNRKKRYYSSARCSINCVTWIVTRSPIAANTNNNNNKQKNKKKLQIVANIHAHKIMTDIFRTSGRPVRFSSHKLNYVFHGHLLEMAFAAGDLVLIRLFVVNWDSSFVRRTNFTCVLHHIVIALHRTNWTLWSNIVIDCLVCVCFSKSNYVVVLNPSIGFLVFDFGQWETPTAWYTFKLLDILWNMFCE